MNNVELKLWHNSCDWVIAKSPTEATNLLATYMGCPVSCLAHLEWSEWTKELKIYDESGNLAGESSTSEWIAFQGEGYLASSEI